MKNVIVLSIKPEYMELILKGQKSIELRKCRPAISEKENLIVALYCTAPVKAVVGFCFLVELIEDTPKSIWNKFSDFVGIDKGTFFQYYSTNQKAFGLKLEKVYELSKSLPLNEIRKKVPNFSPPQTYRYYDLEFLKEKFNSILKEESQNGRKSFA